MYLLFSVSFFLRTHSLTHSLYICALTHYLCECSFRDRDFSCFVLFSFLLFSSFLFSLLFFAWSCCVCRNLCVYLVCVYVSGVCDRGFPSFFLCAHTVCTFPLFFVSSRFFERSHTLLCVCVRECVCFGVCERGFSSLFFCVYSLALSLTYALTRLFALSLSRLLVLSLVCSLTHSLAYLSSRLLARSLSPIGLSF